MVNEIKIRDFASLENVISERFYAALDFANGGLLKKEDMLDTIKRTGGIEVLEIPHLEKLYDVMKELAASNRAIAECLKTLSPPPYKISPESDESG